MKRYLIERDIPEVGSLNRAQLKELAVTSNRALAQLSGKVQWVRSFIAADRTFCIYCAEKDFGSRTLASCRVPDNKNHRSPPCVLR